MSERTDIPIEPALPLPEESARRDETERRVGLRYPFSAAAEVYDVRSKARVTGRCSDLGLGGCYVDTLSPFAVGAVVKIRMERDGSEFQAAAVVAYAHVQMGMGISFTEIAAEHQATLRSWIADASGESPLEPQPPTPPPATAAAGSDANILFVMNSLISLLVRKKLITEIEGAELLRQAFR